MTPSAFRAFTFDCYGTLIDWEQGILRALRALPGIDGDDEALLAAFARHEHAVQEERTRTMLYPAGAEHRLQGDRGGLRPRRDR